MDGWDLCNCTACNTLGIARDLNPTQREDKGLQSKTILIQLYGHYFQEL